MTTIIISVLYLTLELGLALRVYALYRGSRLVLTIILVSAVGKIQFDLTLRSFELTLADYRADHSINIMADMQYYPSINPYPSNWHIKGCFYPAIPNFAKANHTNTVPAILFVLMCIKCYSYRPLCDIPMLLRIWRDGAAYYFVIFVTLFICTLSQYVNSEMLAIVAAIWIGPIYSYSGAHLLLSVRALAAERQRIWVLTPEISENLPDISVSGTLDEEQLSPISEVYELAHPLRTRAASLARTIDTEYGNNISQRQTWMQHWDALPTISRIST
ncbi:uncharacterized protein FIBRA_07078 [Fibroporia radiculosa]|uniref:Uncharacterized protein n=1 Tax=Fibroporia radiculosa TaxID=599839 RepID=J4GDF1_9APHY|nr:uncharacterized protein FIBRA_07078 [Fibroporia radiculosa]CCM04883.1 predicted protein [Fibroporia radiculosa]